MSAGEIPDALAVPSLACPDCGLEQTVPEIAHGMVADCCRCGATLERRAGSSFDAALALTATALLLLVAANLLPLMMIRLEGAERWDWIATGTLALWAQQYRLLGTMVGLFTVVAPFLWLSGLALVLSSLRWGPRRSWLGPLFRWVLVLRPWAMADVFLVGCFVAYTRLQDYAQVQIEPGGWAFVAAALTLLSIDPTLDLRRIWSFIGEESDGGVEPSDFACLGCGRRIPPELCGTRCPRCGTVTLPRKPFSAERTLALVAAGYVLYVPANMLPVMTIVRFGRPEPNTILSGVRELLRIGLWPLALIVFLASIVIPLVKLSGLTWFLIEIRRGSDARLTARTRLYRIIEVIGRWSNIDVFMISILAALVQFGEFTRVSADPGAVAFAGVVVITMFASRSFDARLMWDAAGEGA